MPQMAPLNWLTLLMFFIMIFMLFNMVNFYSFLYKPSMSKFDKKKTTTNWKW